MGLAAKFWVVVRAPVWAFWAAPREAAEGHPAAGKGTARAQFPRARSVALPEARRSFPAGLRELGAMSLFAL